MAKFKLRKNTTTRSTSELGRDAQRSGEDETEEETKGHTFYKAY